MIKRVAYQGEPGSYSDTAVRQIFGDKVESLPHESFEEAFKAVRQRKVDVAVLPIFNTLGGSIHSNFDLMLRYYDLFIVGETYLDVRHCLMVVPGTDVKSIKTVISHPQALAQCDDYCRTKGYKQIAYYDTAGSAKRLSCCHPEDSHCAAIASKLAAQIYGLQVIDEDIQDDKNNVTRFIILSLIPSVPPPPTRCKVSIVFTLIDQTGSLHKCLSVFVLRQINMTKIESRPGRKHLLVTPPPSDNMKIKNSAIVALNTELRIIHETCYNEMKELQPSSFDETGKVDECLLFYLDIDASLNEVRSLNALRHLAEMAPFIRVLGCYPKNGAYISSQNENQLIKPITLPLKSQRLKIGIIGFSRFGQFLAKNLLSDRHEVFAINLRDNEDFTREAVLCGLHPHQNYFQHYSNLPRFFTSASLDVVVFAVSVISFETVLPRVSPYLTNQLLVDVLSVKKHPKTLFLQPSMGVPVTCDLLCTHPMFGPDSGAVSWVNLPFIYEKIRIHDFHRVARFLSFFEDRGCRMVPMQCEEHDRLASGTQFITHLTGRLLAELHLKPTQIDTTGFKLLNSVVQSTARDSFDLFYGIYKHNDFSSEQLYSVEKALSKVKADLASFEERTATERKEAVAAHGGGGAGMPLLVLNPRVEGLSPSKTVVMTDLAIEMKQNGVDVIAMSVGEPDFAPPEAVMEAIAEATRKGHTKYTQLSGTLQLRKAISEYLWKEKHVKYAPDEILCSSGAKQSIFQAIMALCRPGDEVLIPAPYWVSYPEMVKLSGATPVFIPTTASSNFCITPEQLLSYINSKTRMIILCNPSNPTGYVYSKETLQKIATLLLKSYPHVYVLSDEIYEKILYEGEHVSFATFEGMWERTITINGFSKAFAMTGFRLGYLAAPKPIVSACIKVQSHNTTCPPSMVQYAGVVALQKTEPLYFKNAIEGFRQKRDHMIAKFAEIGLNLPVPQGAFYIFFDVSDFLTEDVSTASALCFYLLKNYHVALVPGEAFGLDNHVRISYALSLDQIKEATKRLVAGLTSLKKKKSAL